jgi:YHS domain-containing protein
MKSLLLAVGLAAVLSLPAGASVKPTLHGKTVHAAKAAPLICPVTGETIPSVKDAVGHSVYKGKTYYFCCASCKPMFDKDPAKYVHPKHTKAE